MPHTAQYLRASTRAIVLIATLAAVLLLAPSAGAGTYTVVGTCGVWSSWSIDGSQVAIYPACPALVARNVGGQFNTPPGGGGGWRFDPPAGTSVASVALSASLQGVRGWQAAIFTEGPTGREVINCPGPSCPGASANLWGSENHPMSNSGAVVLRVRCGSGGGCSNAALGGQIVLDGAAVTLSDYSDPNVALTGGTLLSGGWQRSGGSVVVDANDNLGIQEVRVLIDRVAQTQIKRACSFGQKVPCSNGATSVNVPLTHLSDGPHAFQGQAVDGAGNVNANGSARAYVNVDNNAPTRPLDVALIGAPGFRAVNEFKLTWRNPVQEFAPIAAAAYELCPSVPESADAQTKAKARAKCVQGSRSIADVPEIKDVAESKGLSTFKDALKLPGPGLFDLKLWLVDAAGNQDSSSAGAVEIKGLGYDDTPPEGVTFQALDPQDPARVRVSASDAISGLAGGAIEVRRDGQDAWLPLATEVTAGGVTALLDDETLPKGVYFMRARVSNPAGLEASTDRAADGQPATVKLPVRLASSLRAGKRGQRRCRSRGRQRSCRYRLATKPKLSAGRATRLYGRLTVGGKAMPATAVEVWRRLDVDGAGWARLGTVTTSKTGRFSYRARRGPARTIRFRYAGTNMIRGRNAEVALRVRAATTIRSNRRRALNGDYVTFRGRMKGGWIPAAGALVELQVRSGGQWRTFAQPRADATGRWAYRYRFTTVRGRATFLMRARIRRQPDLPFTTGTSRAVRIHVRGL